MASSQLLSQCFCDCPLLFVSIQVCVSMILKSNIPASAVDIAHAYQARDPSPILSGSTQVGFTQLSILPRSANENQHAESLAKKRQLLGGKDLLVSGDCVRTPL